MVKKKFENMFNRFDKIPACDRRSDGQTSCHGIVHAYAEYRAVTIERAENTCNRTTASEIVLFYIYFVELTRTCGLSGVIFSSQYVK